jgi:hypothetical protein
VSVGHTAPIETLRGLVPQWRQNRSVFPGWIIAPLDTCDLLWGRIERSLFDIVRGLQEVGEDERLEALSELVWQLDTALAPLVLTVDDVVADLLDAVVERYGGLHADNAARFRSLAVAIVRHAREENNADLFHRWADWLDQHVDTEDPEARDRLIYERILWHRAELDIDRVEHLVDSWETISDSAYLLRKAGILADLGRDGEAADMSAHALNVIRSQSLRGSEDIAAWSRESFALLFRSSVLYGEIGRWNENRPVRDRFDLRQDQLQARGCPGKRDFFELVERLAQRAPALRQPTERNQKFNPGAFNVTHHLAGVDPRYQRLVAYQALRFQEETGLPVRLGNTGVASQLLTEASRWLIDVAPSRAIDAFLRAAPSPSGKQFDTLLTRATVARMDAGQADRLVDRLLRLIGAARSRVEAGTAEAAFWRDRLKSTLEITSRVALRTPRRAPALLETAIALHADPRFAGKMGVGGELHRLARRCIEAAAAEDRGAMLLSLFRSAIPPDVGDYASDAVDLAAGLSGDFATVTPNEDWRAVIASTIGALGDTARRKAASSRINWLLGCNLLDDGDRRRLGGALWRPDHLKDGLPDDTVFYPSSFLLLPQPEGLDVEATIKEALLDGAPLTDDALAEGNLAYAFGKAELQISGAELVGEIARLHAFVANHGPPPEHPDILGDDRTAVVAHSSRMAASLARRAETHPEAVDPIRDLFALDRHPLRIEPALPALVRLRIVGSADAAQRLRDLFAGSSSISSELLGALIENVLDGADADPGFEAAMWEEIAQTIAARRPGPLARLLRFAAHVVRRDPERIPEALDGMLSLGLALILEETHPTSSAARLEYDPSLVRYFAAVLATAMARRGRGDPTVHAAWSDAIDADPLPDTRRAREKALEGLGSAPGPDDEAKR